MQGRVGVRVRRSELRKTIGMLRGKISGKRVKGREDKGEGGSNAGKTGGGKEGQ